MRSGGIKRTALLVAVTLMAAALPSAAFVASTTKPAAATAPANPGGPFPLHFGDSVSNGMIGGVATPGAGNLEVRGDEDVYTFTVPAGGTRAIFTVPNGGGLNWSLVDGAGREQFASSNFVSNGPEFLAPGPYRLTVTPIANSAYAGAYTFSMNQMPAAQSFNIALDQVVLDGSPAGAGNLESPGASDVYHFSVPSGGAPIYMQSLVGCFCRMWLSQDSTGRLLKSDTSDASFGPMFLAAGNYTMTMRGNTEQTTATYKFKLWRAPDAQVFNFPNFPTTPITASNGVPATGAGNLEMTTSADVYTFPLASVPTNVQISLTGNCGHRFTLIAPSGVTVIDKSCSAPVIVRLTEVGTAASPYRLVVSDYANTYSLNVQSTVAAPTVTLTPTKFNITLKSPTAPPASRAVAIPADVPTPLGAGNIETVGAQDAYAFTGTAGDEIYVEQATGSMWWNLRLPGGRSLFGANGTGSDQRIRLPESGAYVLTVFGSNGTPTGTYTLNIWSVPPPDRFNTTLAAPNAARQIPADVSGTGAGNLESVGTQDVYTFTTTAPGQRLYLGNATSGAYIYWRLIGPDGREFIGSDYYIGLYNGMGETGAVDLRDAGQYQLLVYGANTYHGAYSFSMWTAEAPQTFAINLGDTVSNGVPAAGAGRLEGPGAQDVYTFHADAGSLVYIQGQYSENTHIGWRIEDPAGILRSRAFYGYHADGWWFINETGDFNGGSDVLQIHRSGTYKLVVATGDRFTGNYQFKLWSPPVRPPTAVTIGQPVNGNLDVPGVENLYQFSGVGGKQIKITTTGSHPSWRWCVYTIDGFLPCNAQTWSTVPTISIAPGADPLMKVWDSASNKGTGTYSFSAADAGTSSTGAPLGDFFPIAIGDTVDLNSPAVGAGVIEVPGATDTYQFDAVSGDAVYIDGTGHCSANALFWNLRDPDGTTLFEMPATSLGCQVGPVVLRRTGTYLLSVGGSSVSTTYGFTLRHVTSLQESPADDPSGGAPTITRVTPSSGAAGGTTTVQIYGAHLPKPTAVHVTGNAGDVPVTLVDAASANTALEARSAVASVDLTSVTTSGDYTITVDFADGSTRQAPQPFRVNTGVAPRVDISFSSRVLVPAAVNYAFIQVRNPTDADYYNGIFPITVPCDGTSQMGSVVYPTTVRLVQRAPADPAAITAVLQAHGASSAVVQAFQDFPWDSLVAPEEYSPGLCGFVAYVPVVPSHGAVAIKLEIVPLTPPGLHQSGRLGSKITTHIFDSGTHTDPAATDSSLHEYLRFLGIDFAFGAVATSSSTGDAVVHAASDCFPLEALGLGMAGIGFALIFVPGVGELGGAVAGLALIPGVGSALCHFFPPNPHTPPQKCTPPNPPEGGQDPGDPIAADAGDPGCDPPVQPPVDPNDISGQTEIGRGGTMTYTVNFENVGPGEAAQVDVIAQLDPGRFDLSTFTVEEVGVGHTTTVLSGNAGLATGTLAVNDATVDITSRLTASGALDVDMKGEPNEFQPIGDFLPANTSANRPAGQGYVRFSVQLKDSVALGTTFTQQAAIVFNQHAFGGVTTPTNVWETVVTPNKHPLLGRSLVVGDKPGAPTGRKLTFKATDAAVKALSDPTINGVKLYVRLNLADGTSSTGKYTLPAGGWLRRGTTKYVYKDAKLLKGPVKSATIDLRTGLLKLSAKGQQLTHSLTVMPDTVDVVFLDGGDEICAKFGGTKRTTALKKFAATLAPAPATCPTLVFPT